MVSGWIDYKNGWSGMYAYASGSQPPKLKSMSANANVSLGHGLFPKGGNLAECAAGAYDDEQREVARRLAANRAGDAEIRLGWEASGDWFPWSAAGKPPEQWKACFVRVARAMKSVASALRIDQINALNQRRLLAFGKVSDPAATPNGNRHLSAWRPLPRHQTPAGSQRQPAGPS